MRRSRLLKSLLFLFLTLVVVLGGAIIGRFYIARRAIDRILAGQGLSAEYQITALNQNGAELTDVALKPYGRAKRIVVHWTAASLRAYRATDVGIEDLTINWPDAQPADPVTPSPDAKTPDSSATFNTGLIGALPFDRLTIHNMQASAVGQSLSIPRLTIDLTGGDGWALDLPAYGAVISGVLPQSLAVTGRAKLTGTGFGWPMGQLRLAASGAGGFGATGRYDGDTTGPRLNLTANLGSALSGNLILKPRNDGFAALNAKLRAETPNSFVPSAPPAKLSLDLAGIIRPSASLADAALAGDITAESGDLRFSALTDVTFSHGRLAISLPSGSLISRGQNMDVTTSLHGVRLAGAINRPDRLRLSVESLTALGQISGLPIDASLPAVFATMDHGQRLLSAGPGRITLTSVDVIADQLLISARDSAEERQFSLTAALSQSAKIPWFKPLDLTLGADGLAGNRLRLNAHLKDRAGKVTIEGNGSADLNTLRIDGIAALAPMAVAGRGAAMATLSPQLAKMVPGFAGTIGLLARFGWDGEKLTTGGDILLKDASLNQNGLALSGLNAALTARSLIPPILAPGQELAIGGFGGLPVSNGRVVFGYDGRRIQLQKASFDMAGGQITAGAMSIDPANPKGRLLLTAKDLDLGQLLTLAKVEGLQGSGRLSGSLPLDIASGAIAITDGKLDSLTGTLIYKPSGSSALEQGGGAVALDALKNFHYDNFTMTINGKLGEHQSFGLDLKGNNPDFYNGYPVHFGITVEGDLDKIVRAGLDAYNLPSDLGHDVKNLDQRLRAFTETGAQKP